MLIRISLFVLIPVQRVIGFFLKLSLPFVAAQSPEMANLIRQIIKR
jgi:hypothetical protein